ncbi:MAG: serine/threonine protein kinase [Planctomycetaceae bacterium]
MSSGNTSDNLTIGKYRLATCIATGQHSQVWEVVDNETTRRCAMKLLLPEALKDKTSDALGTLKHEFKVGSSFEHPNIIRFYEISASRKQAYFTMEHFPAPNLKSQMFGAPVGVQVRVKRLIELVAMALEHVHDRGWVHRDIKPENILLNKSSEVRLIDFSLTCRAATVLSKIFARKQATVQGTRTYMAPEQILGKPLSPQTDIYSLGITLFEILAGQAPFAGATPKALLLKHLGETAPNPSHFNPNVTEEMDRIVGRMLAKKPEQRHKKISEFLVEFRNAIPFKEPVQEEVVQSEEEKAKQELARTLGERLDSRIDALRTKVGGGAPQAPRKAAQPTPAPPKPAAPQRAPVAPAAMRPGIPPQMPGMPAGMPMPPQAMPMMPVPMAPYPMPPMLMPPQLPMGTPAFNPATGGLMPWVAAPPPAAPRPAPAVPAIPPATASPPVRPPAPPAVAAPRTVPPAAVPPAAAQKPKPPAPKPAATKPAAPAPAPSSAAFKVDDLPDFDSLPSV